MLDLQSFKPSHPKSARSNCAVGWIQSWTEIERHVGDRFIINNKGAVACAIAFWIDRLSQ